MLRSVLVFLLTGCALAAQAETALPGEVPLFDGQIDRRFPSPSDPRNTDPTLGEQQRQALFRYNRLADDCAARGARAGSAAGQAAWQSGLLYLHGGPGEADRAAAAVRFAQAWRCGYEAASAGLAWCAMSGCSGVPSPADAAHWLDRLLRVNPGRALYLRWLLSARLTPLTTRESGSARPAAGNGIVAGTGNHAVNGGAGSALGAVPFRALLKQAAALGDAQANNEWGIAAVQSGLLQEAEQRFSQAAAAGSPAARVNLELVRLRLDWQRLEQQQRLSTPGVPATEAQGQQWLIQARRYHRGLGVPANYQEAIRYYRMAASAGSLPARDMLALIYSRPAPDGGLNAEWVSQLAPLAVTDDRGGHALTAPDSPADRQRLMQRDPTPLRDLLRMESG